MQQGAAQYAGSMHVQQRSHTTVAQGVLAHRDGCDHWKKTMSRLAWS